MAFHYFINCIVAVETFQGKKLFAEILYLNFTLTHLFLIRGKLPYPLSIWKCTAGSDPVPSFLFSVMSDIGLPDFGGQDLGIDLEKGIFVRKGKKSDNDSNDSGNNSMNTNGSGTVPILYYFEFEINS